MLHASQEQGSSPGPYAMQLHRERMERRARMRAPLAPKKVYDPAIFLPREILVYPAHVFAGDIDLIIIPSRVREIQDMVCKKFKVRREDLLSIRRRRDLVIARQVAMYLCKRHTPNSFPDLGQRFGGRDHTTVLHAVRRVEQMMGAPMGASISKQFQHEVCDQVRRAVDDAEATIATWQNREVRTRHPARAR